MQLRSLFILLLLLVFLHTTLPTKAGADMPRTTEFKNIELKEFSAEAIYGGILLKWKTSAEYANSYFIVERSVDGSDFDAITEVDGAGNATYANNYSFQDNDLVSIHKGEVYYRLKQVDFDGSENTSQAAEIKLNTKLEDFNVASDFIIETIDEKSQLTISLDGLPEFEMVFVQFIDNNGQVAAESAVLTNEIGQFQGTLDLPLPLSAGTYTVVGSSPELVIHKELVVE